MTTLITWWGQTKCRIRNLHSVYKGLTCNLCRQRKWQGAYTCLNNFHQTNKNTLTVRKFGLSTQKINIYQYSFFSSTSLNWIKQRCELFSQTSQIMTNIAGKLWLFDLQTSTLLFWTFELWVHLPCHCVLHNILILAYL